MSKIKDGGPAFPTPCDRFGEHSPSMSLRDWFAGQAMAALIQMSFTTAMETDAKSAYQMADAMLKAREAGNE